jgi:regulator of replication initiation timing
MSNHYKATIAQLEAARLKLINDNIALREDNEKLRKQIARMKAKAAKAARPALDHEPERFDGNHDTAHV